MTSGVIGGAIFQWPLGLLSDKLDRRRVLAATTLGAALVGLVILLAGEHVPEIALMLLGGLWGGMAFPLYSIAVALTNDHARPDEYVQVSSGLLLMYGVGAIVGPLLAGLTMAATGPIGLYIFSAVVHLSLFSYVGIRALKPLPVPVAHQVDFSDALASAQTTSAVLEMREEDEVLRKGV
jgi:MFS family permease